MAGFFYFGKAESENSRKREAFGREFEKIAGLQFLTFSKGKRPKGEGTGCTRVNLSGHIKLLMKTPKNSGINLRTQYSHA